MALSFSLKLKADIGGRQFRCYEVTCDGSTKTVFAGSIEMTYIETAMVGQMADIHGTQSLDMGELTDTVGSTVAPITITGAVVGDFLLHNMNLDLVDQVATGYIKEAAVGEIRVCNETGSGQSDVGDGTYSVRVPKNIGLKTTAGLYIEFSPALRSGDTFPLAVIGY